MRKALIRDWCSENMYFLNMVSSMIFDAFENLYERDKVSLNLVGQTIPFDNDDVAILDEVLNTLGYKDSKVRIERTPFSFQIVSINFSWSEVQDNETWLFKFLNEERGKNEFWLEEDL